MWKKGSALAVKKREEEELSDPAGGDLEEREIVTREELLADALDDAGSRDGGEGGDAGSEVFDEDDLLDDVGDDEGGIVLEDVTEDKSLAGETETKGPETDEQQIDALFEDGRSEEKEPSPEEAAEEEKEPPVVMLSEDNMASLKNSKDNDKMLSNLKRVEGSVENFKREALTAGQLRSTIEETIKKGLSDLGGLSDRIRDLFKQESQGAAGMQAPQGAQPEALEEAIKKAVAPLSDTLDSLADSIAQLGGDRSDAEKARTEQVEEIAETVRAVRSDLASGSRDEKLNERLLLFEERMVSWLERINVRAGSYEKKADQEHARVSAQLDALLQKRADAAELKQSLYNVKAAVGTSAGRLHEVIMRNMILRMFFTDAIEQPLQSINTALSDLEGIIRKLD